MPLDTRRLTPSFRQALSFFANTHRFARAMEKPWATVQYWVELGYIPEAHAMRVEQVTGGEVRAVTVMHEAHAAKLAKKQAKAVAKQEGT